MLLAGLAVPPPSPRLWLRLPGNSSAGSDGNEHGVLSHELGADESVRWGARLHEFPSHGQVASCSPRLRWSFWLGSRLTSPQRRSSAAEPASGALRRCRGSESCRWCQLDPAQMGEMVKCPPSPSARRPCKARPPSPSSSPRQAPGSSEARGFCAPTSPGTGPCRQHELILTYSKY